MQPLNSATLEFELRFKPRATGCEATVLSIVLCDPLLLAGLVDTKYQKIGAEVEDEEFLFLVFYFCIFAFFD